MLLVLAAALDCSSSDEPWGRYSASGALVGNHFYSIGGDTQSSSDNAGGGVVRTNFRYELGGCWERLPDSDVEIGYRGTAVELNGSLVIFGGGDRQRQAVDSLYSLNLSDHSMRSLSPGPAPRYKHAAAVIGNAMVVTGGRGDIVYSDTWIWDGAWTQTPASIAGGLYRHAMAWDGENIWIFGGIDANFNRVSTMWRGSTTSFDVVSYSGTPGARASHALEYWEDRLVMYGGTCSDSSLLWIFDIPTSHWCSVAAAHAPSLRDAFLWGLDGSHFYVVGGDVICIEAGRVYTIMDVHRIDLYNLSSWHLVYNPRNQRAPQITALCDGTNRGNCRTPPLAPGPITVPSTCNISDFRPPEEDDDVVVVDAATLVKPGLVALLAFSVALFI